MMQRLAVLLGLCGLPCIVAGGGVWIEEGTLEGNTTGGEGAAASVTLELKPQSSICIHTVQDWVDFSPVFMPMGCGLALMPSMLEGLVLNADGTARLSLGGRDSASGSATVGAPSLRWGWLSDVVSIHLCEGGVQSWCYACGRLHGGEYSVSCSHVPECEARFGAEYDCTCPMMIVRVNWDDDDGDETEDRQAETLAMAENDLDTYRALGSSQSCWCHAEEMSGSRVAGLAASSELRLWSGEELAAESAATFNLEAVRASDDIGSGYFRYDVYDATNGFLRTVIRQVTAANLEFRPDWDDSGVVDFFDRQRLQPYSRPSRWQLRVREMPYLLQLASECPMAMALALGQHCTGGTAPRLVAANGAGVPAKNEVQNVLIDTSAGEGDLALEFVLGLSAAATNLIDTLAIHVVDASVKERWTVAGAAAGVTYDYSSVDGDVYWNVWRYTDDGREWLAGGSDHVFTLRGLEAGDYQVEVYFDGIYEDGVQGYTATGDFHVLDVRLERLYETANPANRIFNPTRKDDTSGNFVGEKEHAGTPEEERYAVPRNYLYVVGDPDTGNFNVTARFSATGAEACTNYYCAFYGECNNKIPNSETNVDFNAESVAFSLSAPAAITNVLYQLRGGVDINDNGELDEDEALPFTVYTNSEHRIKRAYVKGITKEKYDDDLEYIQHRANLFMSDDSDAIFPVPRARTLLKLFYLGGAERGITADLLPNAIISNLAFNVRSTDSSCYAEWLTHNSGLEFGDDGVGNINEYVWAEESEMSGFIAEQTPFRLKDYTISIGGIVTRELSDTGRMLNAFYNDYVRNEAETILEQMEVGQGITMPTNEGWYTQSSLMSHDVFLSLSPQWVSNITVNVGIPRDSIITAAAMDALAYRGILNDYEAFITIGRGRLVDPMYRFDIIKMGTDISPMYVVTNIAFRCSVRDLYDFNYEDGKPATQAASVQVGFSAGNDSERSRHGRIFRHSMNILKNYAWPFSLDQW